MSAKPFLHRLDWVILKPEFRLKLGAEDLQFHLCTLGPLHSLADALAEFTSPASALRYFHAVRLLHLSPSTLLNCAGGFLHLPFGRSVYF